MRKDTYNIIGVMSGSSLDGIDIVLVCFTKKGKSWDYEFIQGNTYPYSRQWKEKLIFADQLSPIEFFKLNKEYGRLTAERILEFMEDCSLDVDLIGSHGHTVIHQPDQRITFQIGDGYTIANITNTPVITDFRSRDVALNGQGAPLVPRS